MAADRHSPGPINIHQCWHPEELQYLIDCQFLIPDLGKIYFSLFHPNVPFCVLQQRTRTWRLTTWQWLRANRPPSAAEWRIMMTPSSSCSTPADRPSTSETSDVSPRAKSPLMTDDWTLEPWTLTVQTESRHQVRSLITNSVQRKPHWVCVFTQTQFTKNSKTETRGTGGMLSRAGGRREFK